MNNLKKWNWGAFAFIFLIAILCMRTMVRTHHIDGYMVFFGAFIIPMSFFVAYIGRDK